MKALTKEDLIAAIEADPSLRDVLKRYDIHAAPFLLYASPRLQPDGQSWASHAALIKSDENILYPFQVVACHQNLGGRLGFNSFDYWSVGFQSLDLAAQAFLDVQNMGTAYLDEVRYDTDKNRFVHLPNPGRIEFELSLPLALIA